MSLAGAFQRVLSNRNKRDRKQAVLMLATLQRAARPVVESLERRQLLSAAVYPQIVVQGGLTPTNIAYQDATPATLDGTDFGNVDIKKNAVETFVIKNTGAGVLNLTSFSKVSVTGANASDFVVTAPPAALLAPGAKTTFSMKFAPSATGVETGAVTIYNDTDGMDPFTFSVKGTGTSASRTQVIGLASKIIAAGDTTLLPADGTNFGSVESAVGNASETFTIKNLGSAILNLTGSKVSVSGPDAAAFTVTTPPPATVAVGGSATFVVKFAPGSSGTKNAIINVTSDDAITPTYHFAVSGTGVNQPAIALQGTGNNAIVSGATTTASSNGTDFGNADLVLNSVTNTFKIVNNGSLALGLTGNPIISISGTGKTAFTVVAQPASSVSAGSNITFQIKFAPGSVGAKTATVAIANNLGGANHPYTFTITGNAVSVPQIDVQGGSPLTDLTAAQVTTSTTDGTDFGSADTLVGGATHLFNIKDLGSGNLTGVTVALSGADASQFSIVAPPASDSLLGKVTARPAAVPAPMVSSGHHHHHTHTTTKHHFHTGTVAHPSVSSVAVANAETFGIKFAPTDATSPAKTATVTVTSNDPNVPSYTFAIGGTALSVSDLAVSDAAGTHAIPSGDVTTGTVDGTDFGSLDTTQTVAHTFTLKDIGSQPLNQGSATTISDPTDFTVTTDYGSSIASTATDHLVITFNPTTAGVKTGVVTIATDDPNSPYTFTVKGTATNSAVNQVQGNSVTIASGDTTPSTSDYTDLGSAELNTQYITRTFTINNTGSGSMTISHVTITGAAHADFTVLTPPAATVAAGASTTMVVKFDPSAAGVRAATITVQTNDPATPNYVFAVQGTGIRLPEMDVLGKLNANIPTGDTTPLVSDGTDFGNVDPAAPLTRVFSIKNLGSDALNLTGSPTVAVSGTNPGDFVVTTHPRVSTAAGAASPFSITFTPSIVGAEDAIITIASDDAGSPYTFEVAGTGVASPVISVKGGTAGTTTITTGDTTPQPADGTDFGATVINNGTVSNTFVIANPGSADLHLTGTPLVAISGPNAGDFSVTVLPASPVTLGGGTSNFIVKFAPTAAGIRTAIITIASDDPNIPSYTFLVKGTGITAPIMQVLSGGSPIVNGENAPDTSNNTDFGATELANGFVTQMFTIKDVGSAGLVLNGTPLVKVTGSNAADFTVVAQPAATVAVNGTITFQVKFKPTAAGVRTANIVIASNDSSTTPYTFAVAGTAVVQPVLSVIGNSKNLVAGQTATSTTDGTDFGSTPSFTGSVAKTFTIKNTGSAPLNLNLSDLVDISGPDAADFLVTTPPPVTTLAAGASTTFTITFMPTNNAVENATVSIDSDDPNGAFVFNIKGTGTAS